MDTTFAGDGSAKTNTCCPTGLVEHASVVVDHSGRPVILVDDLVQDQINGDQPRTFLLRHLAA